MKKKDMSRTCRECGARCCRYITVKISAPKDKIDREEIRWWLHHENVIVTIERRKWYVQFNTPCTHLTADSRCAIYENRPSICADHDMEECEYLAEDDDDTVVFETAADFDDYFEERKARRKARKRRKKEAKLGRSSKARSAGA